MKPSYYMCDFETTVYDNQERTDVWAAAIVEFQSEKVEIFGKIEDFFEHIFSKHGDLVLYFHNLKFDGAFILNYLMHNTEWKQAIWEAEEKAIAEFINTKYMENNTFRYSISDMGQWYSITLKQNNRIIEIRDSLKLLPFSVKAIGNSFGTKHKKLDMEYKGYRYPGCNITDEEKQYIANDVLVVKEALEILFSEGHNKLTIGSCCLKEFKKGYNYFHFNDTFPDVYNQSGTYASTYGEYVRKSYRGGWCYVVPEKSNKVIQRSGITLDVNSLYPSMMHSESGNYYPTGLGFLVNNPTIEYLRQIDPKYEFYFVRFKTRFYLKPGYLPFVQIKNNKCYVGTKCLTTSDVWDAENKRYCRQWRDRFGEVHEAIVELTMTMADFELFLEHYYVEDFEILDAVEFQSEIGLFDTYINHWKEVKLNSTGAKRQLAKLFLNNLYGKMAASTESSFKVAYLKDDGSNGFYTVYENKKKPGYIPIGSAITSYARCFTIRAAQQNFHGTKRPGFIYADTDSIHCDMTADNVKGVKIHDKDFCCWKCEGEWDSAIFVRQKTYIEHITNAETPYYDVKCAGMPDRSKQYFINSMLKQIPDVSELTNDEIQFYYSCENGEYHPINRTLKDFTYGLTLPGKLIPVQYPGGVVLEDTWYEMRERK